MTDMTDIDALSLTKACHGMLLRLAGRIPDGLLGQSRAWLAALAPERMAHAVASHAAASRLPLPPDDAALLRWILAAAGIQTEAAQQMVTDPAAGSAPAYAFVPAPPETMAARGEQFGPCLDLTAPGWCDEDEGGETGTALGTARPAAKLPWGLTDGLDAAAAGAAAGIEGAAALWRAWRIPDDGAPWPPPRPVFLLALDPPGQPFEAAAVLQDRLAGFGEGAGLVEAFDLGEQLPPYQRAARARAALLWTARLLAPIRLAPVYDTVSAGGEPSFDPRRPRLAPADREPVAALLDGGSVLMSTATRLDDVLDPVSGRGRVPAGFRTDGRWVWSDAVTYYVRVHGVAPVADLLLHLRTADPTSPDAVDLFRAAAALTRVPPDEPPPPAV